MGGLIMSMMSGRYGKYGEMKRLARLWRSKRELSGSEARADLQKGRARKGRSFRRHFSHHILKDGRRRD
jgi:hypothetical protein